MTKINLLPWREERRKELQRQFFSIAGGVAVLSVLCVYVVFAYFQGEVDNQLLRNKRIQTNITELESKITEITELQKRREQIVDSMKVIQDLQGNRPVIVHAMGEIAKSIPDGVYYTKISKKGTTYHIYGIAETNNKISKLMRNLDESEWFKDPNLIKVTGNKAKDKDDKSNVFELTVSEDIPSQANVSDTNG